MKNPLKKLLMTVLHLTMYKVTKETIVVKNGFHFNGTRCSYIYKEHFESIHVSDMK